MLANFSPEPSKFCAIDKGRGLHKSSISEMTLGSWAGSSLFSCDSGASFLSAHIHSDKMLSRRSLAILAALAVFAFCQAAAELRFEHVDQKVPAAQLSPAQIEHKLHVWSFPSRIRPR